MIAPNKHYVKWATTHKMLEESKKILTQFREFVLEQTPSILGFEEMAPAGYFPQSIESSFSYSFVFPLIIIVDGNWIRTDLFFDGHYTDLKNADILIGKMGFMLRANKNNPKPYKNHTTLFFAEKKEGSITFQYKPFDHPEQYDQDGKFSNPYLNITQDAFNVYRQFLADFKTNIHNYISLLIDLDLVISEEKPNLRPSLFPRKVFERGQIMSLFNVKSLHLCNNETTRQKTLIGTVTSSDFNQDYCVNLFFDSHYTYTGGVCSCPFNQNNHVPCKHLAAVSEAIKKNEMVALINYAEN